MATSGTHGAALVPPPLSHATGASSMSVAVPPSPAAAPPPVPNSPNSSFDLALEEFESYLDRKITAGKLALSASKRALKVKMKNTFASLMKSASPPVVVAVTTKSSAMTPRLPHVSSVTYRAPMREVDDSAVGSSHMIMSSAGEGSGIPLGNNVELSMIEFESVFAQDLDALLADSDEENADEMHKRMEVDGSPMSVPPQQHCDKMAEYSLVVHKEECECDTIEEAAHLTRHHHEEVDGEVKDVSESVTVHLHHATPSSTPRPSQSKTLSTDYTARVTYLTTHEGYVVAHHNVEHEDGKWVDSEAFFPAHVVPRAPHRTCDCIIPYRSFSHLKKHVQPHSHRRHITFEGGYYPEWRGEFYSNGEPKSVMRGVVHELSIFLVSIFAIFLFMACQSAAGYVAAAIFIFTQLNLYVTSSQFHRRKWMLPTLNKLKRLDHSAIFLLAAGSSTAPAIMMILDDNNFVHISGIVLITWAWFVSLSGVAHSMTKSLRGRVNLFGLIWMGVSGGCMVPFVYQCYLFMTTLEFSTTIIAWLIYLLSICIYSKKWMNFWPSIWGYHDSFHFVTIIGAVFTCTFNYSIIARMK